MAEVRIFDVASMPGEEFRRWDIDGHQISKHLTSAALTGTPDVVADVFTFPPGFVHHMHRHPHADQFIFVLSGSVRFFGAAHDGVDIYEGQLLLIPRGNWHEVRNVTDQDCTVFHFFAGVGSVSDIGYEAPGSDSLTIE